MPTEFDNYPISRRINTWVGPDGTDTDYEGSHPELRMLPRADPDKAWKRFLEQWEKWVELTPLALAKPNGEQHENQP